MPVIDDDEFLKICNELDRLIEKEKDLKKGYIDLKLENNKISSYKKYRNIIIVILISMVVILFGYIYKKQTTYKAINEQKFNLERLIDSIGKEKEIKLEESLLIKKEERVIFAVQIGIFKEFNIPDESSKLMGGIRKLPNNPEKYIAGEFYTYEKARVFRNEIRKIGIKDAFIVSLYKGKKIPISRAIKLANE